MKEHKKKFITTSNRTIEALYTPETLGDWNYDRDLNDPGKFPYTRGIHATMYRSKLWTMRQFAGFGSPEETNQRFKFLMKQGQHGLSTAFDVPTLMGIDSDQPRAAGEVGKCGVAIDSLEDMEILFQDIPLDVITTSMTVNGPASVILAMYFVAAEKRGIPLEKLGGTIQNDVLKEFIAQNCYCFPPDPAVRIVVDMIEFCMKKVPKWNPISISGYHIREAGTTAVQELAFTLADGIAYVEACIKRGLAVDSFAPRLSFFFDVHNDFFEEIAKLRAARRIWAKIMRDRFHAKDERSLKLRFHSQTAGVSLTAQQPYNNVVRTAIQALAAVLGGTQSLHCNAWDETLALPTELSALTALRTQQIIAHESGVTNTVDPLAGSYFVEKLTDTTEAEAMQIIQKIDAMGGMVQAVKAGTPQREIVQSSYIYQKQLETKEQIVVGVNDFTDSIEAPMEILKISEETQAHQTKKLAALKKRRDNEKVLATLAALKKGAAGDTNLMPLLCDCVRAYCTQNEMIATLQTVFGEYRDPAIY